MSAVCERSESEAHVRWEHMQQHKLLAVVLLLATGWRTACDQPPVDLAVAIISTESRLSLVHASRCWCVGACGTPAVPCAPRPRPNCRRANLPTVVCTNGSQAEAGKHSTTTEFWTAVPDEITPQGAWAHSKRPGVQYSSYLKPAGR